MNMHNIIMIKFNWWMVIAPALLILSILIGRKGVVLTKTGVRYTFNERFSKLVAGLSGFIFFVLLLVESIHGVVQWFDNSLTTQDSPVGSVVLAPGAIAIAALLYGGIIFEVIQATQRHQAKKLRKFRIF